MILRNHFKKEKGQDLVEYALLLGIVVGIGWMVYSETGLSNSINSIFGNVSNVLNVAAKSSSGSESSASKTPYDLDAFIKYVNETLQTNYTGKGNTPWGLKDSENYTRGMLMSSWLSNGDESNSKVTEMAKELGADLWTYYNGMNSGIDQSNKGFYWTTDNISASDLHSAGTDDGYSKEKVLSYYYDGTSYYVYKNNVWMGQGKNGDKLGLAARGQEYTKPAGEKVGQYSSYEAAQKAYNEAKAKNNGSTIFK